VYGGSLRRFSLLRSIYCTIHCIIKDSGRGNPNSQFLLAEPLVDLLHDLLSPLNACSDQLVTPWTSLRTSEEIVSRLHVQTGEDRSHDSDDTLAALVHLGIVQCSPLFRQPNVVRSSDNRRESTMNLIPLQNGDMVEVINPFSLTRHVGIYAAGRGFVHNDKACCVALVDEATFTGGRKTRLIGRVVGGLFEQEQVVQRALSLIGQPYDLLTFNCEHLAYYAQTGVARSPQLAAGFAVALAMVFLIAIRTNA
jgi:lecithin:retinol acyltransferase